MARRFMLAICAIAALALPAWSADNTDSLPVLKTKVKTIAAFKNGLGFVFRAGTTELSDGWAAMDEIPPAALGTLWIGTPNKSGPVQDIISYKGKQQKQRQATSMAEILSANVGKEASVTYTAGGNSEPATVDGTILSVPAGGEIVLISDRSGTLALNKSSIIAVQLHGAGEQETKFALDVNRAKFRVGGSPKSAEITIAYLEKGITWSPSYLVNVANDKEAEITLESVLANDAEDLDDTEISFVVGYPNFMFADRISPLSLQQSVASFVQGLMDSPTWRYPSSLSAVTQIAYNAPAYERDAGDWAANSYSTTGSLPGETNEDLYFYRQDHVTLKKGDRARYSVFSAKVPCEHVYQWDVPDSTNVDDRGYRIDSSGNRRDGGEIYQVWHALKLQNTTKEPWTTAPAFTVNGPMPVAQDVMKYTPSGGKSTLKLTVASDVKADQDQTEVSRTPVQNKSGLDEVVVSGKLTVKNWKKKPVRMNILKSIVGSVKESGQDGKATKVVKRLTSLNPTSQIVWEFDLGPGQQQELTYKYSTLIWR